MLVFQNESAFKSLAGSHVTLSTLLITPNIRISIKTPVAKIKGLVLTHTRHWIFIMVIYSAYTTKVQPEKKPPSFQRVLCPV